MPVERGPLRHRDARLVVLVVEQAQLDAARRARRTARSWSRRRPRSRPAGTGARARRRSRDQRSGHRLELHPAVGDRRRYRAWPAPRRRRRTAPAARSRGEVHHELEPATSDPQPALVLVELDRVDVAGREAATRLQQLGVERGTAPGRARGSASSARTSRGPAGRESPPRRTTRTRRTPRAGPRAWRRAMLLSMWSEKN